MKKLLLAFITLISIQSIATETSTGANRKGDITGTIIDASDNRAIEYATVALYKKAEKELVTGGISDSEGFFRIKNTAPGDYYLTVTFMGYKTKEIPNIKITDKTKEFEIGTIVMSPNNQEIEEVSVVADQASVQYKIDKKVVNVSQQLTAKSGTAVDILENVPSVKVDIEGNVTLRGSGEFTVLIDGRPTVLDPSDALAQIPAGAIENIEIITNPSAKYEPDGTAGILNIITKKNKLNGVSGIVNLNAGTNGNFDGLYNKGGDFTVDLRQEKWHFYIGGDYNSRERNGDMEYTRDKLLNPYSVYNQDTFLHTSTMGDFVRSHAHGGLRAGADWAFSKADNLGINARMGNRSMSRSMYKDYEEWTSPSDIAKSYYKTADSSSRGGMFYSLTLDYKHTFNKNKEHYLQFQSTVDARESDEESLNLRNDLDGNLISAKKSNEAGPSQGYRINLDYSQPFAFGGKIETGGQLRVSNSEEDNNVYDFVSESMTYERQDLYSNTTQYKRNTYAAYSTFGGEYGDLGYQAGLRMEYTDRLLKYGDQEFEISRPDLFPTLHFSYQLPAEQQTMLSYTRRIVRPRGWYLEPFITYMDAYNVRMGNPDLSPEFVNSFELGYQKKIKKNFVSVEAYYRMTENKIERVMESFSGDVNAVLHTYKNIGASHAAGTEIMANFSPTRWYTTNLMADLYYYELVNKSNEASIEESSDFSWTSRFNNTFKASPNTRIQLDFMYQSDRITAQGTYKGFFSASAAVKQDFFKRKLSATLQVRDVFGGWKHEFITDTYELDQYTYFNPKTPITTLTLSYKINNYKVKRGKGGSGENGGGEDDGAF